MVVLTIYMMMDTSLYHFCWNESHFLHGSIKNILMKEQEKN